MVGYFASCGIANINTFHTQACDILVQRMTSSRLNFSVWLLKVYVQNTVHI